MTTHVTTPRLQMLNWPRDGKTYAKHWKIGSENEDGSHRRDREGWPYSVYLEGVAEGVTDAVLCHGIQNEWDAKDLRDILNASNVRDILAAR